MKKIILLLMIVCYGIVNGATAPTSLNEVYSTECDSLTGWTTVLDVTVTDGVILIAGVYSNDNSYMTRDITFPSTDFIFYIKFKADTPTLLNTFSYFKIGTPTAPDLGTRVYIDHNGTSETKGSLYAKVGLLGLSLGNGLDLSVWTEMAIQFDHKADVVNFFIRSGSVFDYKGSLSYSYVMPSGTEAILVQMGDYSLGQDLYVDYITVAKPNIISIGNSIFAGHNYFDPDPSNYVGTDPYNNCFQSYCNILSSNRNSLIVNKGVGGNSSTQVLARIVTDVIDHAPLICIVEGTLNDYSTLTLAQKTTNQQSIIDSLNAAGISVFQTNDIAPALEPSGTYYETWNTSYYSTLTGVDLFIDALIAIDTNSDGRSDAAYVETDGVHPNAAGYALMGNKIQSDIDAYYTPASSGWSGGSVAGVTNIGSIGGVPIANIKSINGVE